MTDQNTEYMGSCLCGGVKFRLVGDALAAGYCHCEVCRTWHAAPFNSWALWASNSCEVVEGQDLIASYKLTDQSERHWCTECGAGLFNQKNVPFHVVYTSTLSNTDYAFKPTMHVFYAERIMDINDSLVKFSDFPAEFGGSGEVMA